MVQAAALDLSEVRLDTLEPVASSAPSRIDRDHDLQPLRPAASAGEASSRPASSSSAGAAPVRVAQPPPAAPSVVTASAAKFEDPSAGSQILPRVSSAGVGAGAGSPLRASMDEAAAARGVEAATAARVSLPAAASAAASAVAAAGTTGAVAVVIAAPTAADLMRRESSKELDLEPYDEDRYA